MDNPLDQKDSPFRSPIASQIERFLQFKRVAGYKYCKEEEELSVWIASWHLSLWRLNLSLLTKSSGHI